MTPEIFAALFGTSKPAIKGNAHTWSFEPAPPPSVVTLSACPPEVITEIFRGMVIARLLSAGFNIAEEPHQ